MASSSGKHKDGWFYLLGAASILTVIGLAIAPRLLGKKNAVVTPAAVPAAAVAAKPAYNFGVANSLYGKSTGYNFAGMALERPNNVLPLGFHLNNVQ